MTAPKKRPTRAERRRADQKAVRKVVRSPCDRPPITPTNLWSAFDRFGGGRHKKTRAKFRWNEVHEDTSGFRLQIHHYQLEFEYSASDTPGTWHDAERYHVPPKDETEDNNKVHYVIKELSGRLAYRWRVRAVAVGGCRSTWSAYYEMGDPGGENPPAPVAVTIYDGSADRVVVDWEAVSDPSDNETLDLRVKHYACEISKNQGFGNIYKRDIIVKATQRTFKVAQADLGDQFYARAWAVGPDETKSSKIPAKLNGNNDPFVQPDGVTVERSSIPPGVIKKWPGPIGRIPGGFLLCNGNSHSTTQYAELFAAIGYTYGGSGGSFKVPDIRGRKVKGVNQQRGEVEGVADDGRGAEIVAEDRDDIHRPHKRHRHKHHHKNKRRDHDNHANADSDGSGGHTHTVGPQLTPIGGPSATNNNITAGGGTSVAGPNHTHNIGGDTGQGGSGHSHPGIGGTKLQGDFSKQQYGIGGTNPVTGKVPGHGDHIDFYVEPDGANSVMDWSLTGGARGSIIVPVDPWDAGETDEFGNFSTVDSDIDGQFTGKGHRHHPQIRMHFIIKT